MINSVWLEDISERQPWDTPPIISEEPVKKHIVVWTVMWGQKTIDMYKACLLRSLWQPGNLPELLADGYTVEFRIDCTEYESSYIAKENPKKMIVQAWPKGRLNPLSALWTMMKYCYENNYIFVMGMPDQFIGNGSLTNMIKVAAGRPLCLAGLHLRVDEELFSTYLKANPYAVLSNRQLVRMSIKDMPHGNTINSFIDKPNVSYVSGLFIQEITPNLYAIIHRLPTIFIASFRKNDIGYMRDFGCWDHEWPTYLMMQKRFKFIGSSELFYSVEMTEKDSHYCGPLNSPAGNDEIASSTARHKEINRNFVGVISI